MLFEYLSHNSASGKIGALLSLNKAYMYSKPASSLHRIALIALLVFAGEAIADSSKTYDAFIRAAFNNSPPTKTQTLWLNQALKDELSSKFNYRFSTLRIRYWQATNTTAWILDEIGKEQPITMGIVVIDGALKSVEVLEYRESRGGEIRYPFFTQQFQNAKLTEKKGRAQLSQPIDGISGATLSVRAMKKVAKVALYLHTKVNEQAPIAHTTKPQ